LIACSTLPIPLSLYPSIIIHSYFSHHQSLQIVGAAEAVQGLGMDSACWLDCPYLLSSQSWQEFVQVASDNLPTILDGHRGIFNVKQTTLNAFLPPIPNLSSVPAMTMLPRR